MTVEEFDRALRGSGWERHEWRVESVTDPPCAGAVNKRRFETRGAARSFAYSTADTIEEARAGLVDFLQNEGEL